MQCNRNALNQFQCLRPIVWLESARTPLKTDSRRKTANNDSLLVVAMVAMVDAVCRWGRASSWSVRASAKRPKFKSARWAMATTAAASNAWTQFFRSSVAWKRRTKYATAFCDVVVGRLAGWMAVLCKHSRTLTHTLEHASTWEQRAPSTSSSQVAHSLAPPSDSCAQCLAWSWKLSNISHEQKVYKSSNLFIWKQNE